MSATTRYQGKAEYPKNQNCRDKGETKFKILDLFFVDVSENISLSTSLAIL